MKFLFFFLSILFLSSDAHTQPCDHLTLESESYPLLCDSLTISTSPNLSGITDAIDIQVTGDVFINAPLHLNGGQGTSINIELTPGPLGGPGADSGGGRDFNQPAELECPVYEPFGACPYAGAKGEIYATDECADGAGGGGFANSGSSGKTCQGSPLTPSLGGIAFNYSSIETNLRGGFGGGAGGGFDLPTASGGGGGGALKIVAQGKITLTANASITANGGNGANGVNKNGAGGGGSGGVIILEAQEFDIQGRLSTLGGKGGQAPDGGHGGNGSNGLIRLKDAEGVKDFIGEKNPPVIQELKLDSNISCGVIAEKNEEQKTGTFFFQILGPLFFMIFISHFRRKGQDLA